MNISSERGSVSIWLATATFVMMVLVGLAVDLGGQVHAKQRAQDLAAQAARAGGQEVQAAPAIEGSHLSVDTAAARAAVLQYLGPAGVQGTVSVAGDTITVRVNDTYSPRFLTMVGIGELPVTGEATARTVRSIGGAER